MSMTFSATHEARRSRVGWRRRTCHCRLVQDTLLVGGHVGVQASPRSLEKLVEPDTDNWLDRSAPQLSEPDHLGESLIALVVSTRRAAQPRKRRQRRAVLIGTTTAMLIAGGTAAAAAIGGWTAPWASQPLGTLTFTLPSGGTCEQRIGDLRIADARAQSLVQKWLSDHTLAEVADVDAAVETIRAEPDQTWDNGSGDPPITFGYGTEHYDADYEYVDAVFRAESTAVTAKLNDAGFTEYLPMRWDSELRCSGPNPHPSVPEWAK